MSHPLAPLRQRHYRSIVIDPPWRFAAGTEGRPQHYPRMTDDEIAALPLRELVHPDGAWLWVWCTSPKARDLFAIADRWGAKFSGRGFLWVKLNQDATLFTGMGFTTRKNAEDCWLFKFGSPARRAADIPEVILARRREHSRKPDISYDRIERFSEGPYADVFSRESRVGWDSFGNETTKFNEGHDEMDAIHDGAAAEPNSARSHLHSVGGAAISILPGPPRTPRRRVMEA